MRLSPIDEMQARQRSIKRSNQRYNHWNSHKLSIEPIGNVDNIRATAHSIAVICTIMGNLYTRCSGKKILFENLFSKQSCQQVA